MVTALNRHGLRRLATLVVLVVSALVAAGIWPVRWIAGLDDALYDARLRATLPATRDTRIVIVDIDEPSLTEVGRWPWPRSKLAQLTNTLFEQQHVALLGFDVVFAEPEAGPSKDLVTQLQSLTQHDKAVSERLAVLREQWDHDATFARALRQRPVALGYYFTNENHGQMTGVLPPPAVATPEGSGPAEPFLQWTGYAANVAPLAQAAPLAGFINSITDADGVVRSLPLVVQHQGRLYDSLALAMYRQLQQPIGQRVAPLPSWQLGMQADRVHSLDWVHADQRISIPLGERAALRVPYRGLGGAGGGSFTYVSASDVLAGRLPPGQLAGKLVLVGSSAPGLADTRATPVGAIYPGVELHANVLSALLDNRFLVVPADAQAYALLVLLVIGTVLVWVLPRVMAMTALGVAAGAALAVVALNFGLYTAYGLVLPLALHLVLIAIALVLNLGFGYFVEGRAKRDLVRLFGTYVPPELVQQMAQNPSHYTMQARQVELTVMFCDMRGFTALSETMEPLALQRLLNQLFSELTQVISAHQGTVDKYMGDCVMAFWGAPVAMANHAELAVQAALAMQERLKHLNAASAFAGVQMGLGLHTGPMCVGDMGSNVRRSYTVVGNAVNLGSRLEGLSKTYGLAIVVSEATRLQAPDHVWQALDRVRVKGMAQAVAIYTPLANRAGWTEPLQRELTLWDGFLMAYRAQMWSQCDILLAQLLTHHAHRPLYALYATRLTQMRGKDLQATWDGTTHFETK